MTTQIERARPQIADAVVGRLCRRKASAFGKAGSDVCRRHVDRGLDALIHDLGSGTTAKARDVVHDLLDTYCGDGLNFSDLRAYALGLRAEVRAVIEADPATRACSEEWFFEFVLVATMRFMAWRDEVQAEEAAKRGVAHLESQLAELEVALRDKTQLLNLIHQTSTPIVPIGEGILVVPLIGTFDGARTELLTERLLQAIGQGKTLTAILDVSGVPVFDNNAAELMLRLGQAVRLLGAGAILVGLSPQNAKTIVELGIDLGGLETCGTLQDGLTRALLRQRKKIMRF